MVVLWQGLTVGDVLAHRYRIVQLIGEGGMGRVFAAEDLKLANKRWAIKERIHGGRHAQLRDEEMQILLRLQHPNLPKIADYYDFERIGRSYLVMELVEGRTIRQYIEERGSLTVTEATEIGIQLCSLFAYLHRHQPEPIVYRDLKPDNVMIDDQGTVHLIDFGISRTYKEDQLFDTVQYGSPGFFAPEQLRSGRTDPRSDLYQLGALLFYLLSGGELLEEQDDILRLQELSGNQQLWLRQLVSERPDERPQTAEQVKAELLSWQLSTSTSSVLELDNSEMRHQNLNAPQDHRRFILIGSLYSGAGATSLAFDLAQALDQSGYTCSVVEYAVQPEHVYKLSSVYPMPDSYVYLLDRTEELRSDSENEWMANRTVFYPMPPHLDGSQMAIERWYRSLLSIRSDVVIIDIGDRWQDECVRKLIVSADHTICTIDSRMYKWYRRDVERNIELLMQESLVHEHLHIVAFQSGRKAMNWRTFPLPITQKLTPQVMELSAIERYTALLAKLGVKAVDRRNMRRFMKSLSSK